MADQKPMRDGAEEPRLRQYVATMAAAFNGSPLRGILVLLAVGVLVVILATAYGQIVLNRWNQPFYDALEQRNMPAFLAQLLVFFEIAGALLVLNVAQLWLNQMLHLKLREALTRDMIDEWLRPGRAFRVARRGQIGINPDQRLHEDAHHLSDLSVDLGVGLLQAGILLISFVGVLWALSSGFVFHLWGAAFQIPGYMVWAAILYSGTASWLSWMVGRPLIALNGDRYAREADLRYSLMRCERTARRDLGLVRRGGRGKTPSARSRRGHGRNPPHRFCNDAPCVGDLGLWLGNNRCAHYHSRARLFRRRHDVRRADDGCRRVQPVPCLAQMVRRQYRLHRGLARDARAGSRHSGSP